MNKSQREAALRLTKTLESKKRKAKTKASKPEQVIAYTKPHVPTLLDHVYNLRQDLESDMKALQAELVAAEEKQAAIKREMIRVDGGIATLAVLLDRNNNADNKDAK